MRRSRLVFGIIFAAIASLLFVTRLQRPDTFTDIYNGSWRAPSFSKPSWMTDDGSPSSSSDNVDNLPPPPPPATQQPQTPPLFPPPTSSDDKLNPPQPNDSNQQFSAATSTPALSAAEPTSTTFDETKYLFQLDLDLPLPARNLSLYSSSWPHNYKPLSPHSTAFAYAALVNTRNPSIRDPYFMALQNLIWRVLWSPRSRTTSHPFIAFVAPHITPEQRHILAGAGALVRELPPLDWNPPSTDEGSHPIFGRFKDMFSKLHMWNQTDFARILFLDADAFPVVNVDAMLSESISPTQICNETLLDPTSDTLPDGTSPACREPFVFAGVPQGIGLPVEINVGAMVFTPSSAMYQRFLANYQKYDRYVVHMADQGFLSWMFRVDGAFPTTQLERKWDGFFPQQDEKGLLKIVHEKLWAPWSVGWLGEEWNTGWKDMLAWYEGASFEAARQVDERGRVEGWEHVNGPEVLGQL